MSTREILLEAKGKLRAELIENFGQPFADSEQGAALIEAFESQVELQYEVVGAILNMDLPDPKTVLEAAAKLGFSKSGTALPDGDYAICEIMGFSTLVGRVAEVDRFGTKFLQIEPIFQGKLLGPVLQGGSSIYRMTPCSRDDAFKHGPKDAHQLPSSVRATLPATALPAPTTERGFVPGPADPRFENEEDDPHFREVDEDDEINF